MLPGSIMSLLISFVTPPNRPLNGFLLPTFCQELFFPPIYPRRPILSHCQITALSPPFLLLSLPPVVSIVLHCLCYQRSRKFVQWFQFLIYLMDYLDTGSVMPRLIATLQAQGLQNNLYLPNYLDRHGPFDLALEIVSICKKRVWGGAVCS